MTNSSIDTVTTDPYTPTHRATQVTITTEIMTEITTEIMTEKEIAKEREAETPHTFQQWLTVERTL